MITAENILLVSNCPTFISQIRECIGEFFPKTGLSLAPDMDRARDLLTANPPGLLIAEMDDPGGKVLDCLYHMSANPPCPLLMACNPLDLDGMPLNKFPGAPMDFIIKSAASKKEISLRIERLLFSREKSRKSRFAEERLRKSEETLRQILNLVPHHIHAKDADGRFIMANKAVAESYHMTPEQFVGTSHLEIAMDRKEALGMLRDDREVMETGRPKHIPEETCIDADGNVHWLETTKVPFENNGEPAVLVVANDITERKRAELLAQMQRDIASGLAAAITMEQAVNACLEAALKIASVDRVGFYLRREDGGLDLAGQSNRSTGSSPMPEHYPPSAWPSRTAARGWAEYCLQGLETISPSADSVAFGLSTGMAIIPVLHENNVLACMIVGCAPGKGQVPLSDRLPIEAVAAQIGIGIVRLKVEERLRKTEAQFLQAQKMEAVGHLAGGIAHDFNNLLSAMMGYTELSQISLTDTPDDAKKFLDQVIQACKRARNLVQKLLAFSRKQVLEIKVADLNIVIQNLEKMLRRLIGEHISLQTNLSENLWPVRVDTTQMEQILINLAVNARDAMPHGGTLYLETSNSGASFEADNFFVEEKDGEWVKLVVRDTGEGMDKTTLAHAFEPFFTTKEQDRGTGLGLSTVYGIIKQHGGQIHTESLPEKGTTFTILLPRTRETVQKATEITATANTGRHDPEGTTLLLVEDEAVVRILAEKILRRQGYEVLSAVSGLQALELAKTHFGRINLLITDVIMPGMNGKDLYLQLSGIIPGLRVLYMSGYDGDIISRHGVLNPGINFLRKPFSFSSLSETVQAVLEN